MASAADHLHAAYVSLLAARDVTGLTARCYTPDAHLHGFGFQAAGTAAIVEILSHADHKWHELGPREEALSIVGRDFVWQETRFPESPEGTTIYDFMFLRDGLIRLHLVGDKQGLFWLDDDFAGSILGDQTAAHALHHRYIELEAKGDADGLVNDFYTPDARIVTTKLQIEGQAALRSFFTRKFANETDFHLVSLRNLMGGDDYVWFEATAASSAGSRTVYDVMMLRDGAVSLQLVGVLDGVLPANRNA